MISHHLFVNSLEAQGTLSQGTRGAALVKMAGRLKATGKSLNGKISSHIFHIARLPVVHNRVTL